MRSITQALVWETVARGKWSIPFSFVLANLFPVFTYVCFSAGHVISSDPSFLILHFAFLPLMIFIASLGIVGSQGSASRLYGAPIATSSLVAWHVIPCGLLLGCEIALACSLHNYFFHANFPVFGPALYAVAAWSCCQWLIHGSHRTFVGFCISGSIFLFLLFWLRARYTGWWGGQIHNWEVLTVLEVTTLIGVILVCWLLTYLCVASDRSGEPLWSIGIGAWLLRQLEWWTDSDRVDSRAFSSPTAAQFWYEWKQKGMAFPVLSGTLPLMVLGGWVLGKVFRSHQPVTVEDLRVGLWMCGGFMVLFSCGLGLLLGISTLTGARDQSFSRMVHQTSVYSFGQFQATRPVSNFGLSKAMLQTAGLSVVSGWGLWIMALGMFSFVAWGTGQLPLEFFPNGSIPLLVAMVLIGSWIGMTNIGWMVVTGRGTAILSSIIGLLVLYVIVLAALDGYSSRSNSEFFQMGSALLATVAIVAGTCVAYYQASRCGVLTSRSILGLCLLGIGIAIGLALIAPSTRTMIHYALGVAIPSLAILPFALMPLAIAWNRNR